MKDVFELRIIVDDQECMNAVYSIHHLPTDLAVRHFFDCDEAERVLGQLTSPAWSTPEAKGDAALLAELDRACAAFDLARRLIVSEDTGELIVWCWGSPSILRAVDAAERACA